MSSTSTSHLDLPERTRPGDRVRNYLESEIDRLGNRADARLPTTRRLADELNVSPRTVLSVYREYADSGRIYTKVGDGTYLKGERKVSQNTNRPLQIAVGLGSVPPGAGHPWPDGIYTGLLRRTSQMNPPMSLMPISAPADDPNMAQRFIEKADDVDGLVLFPIPGRPAIRAAYEAAGKPVVHINPFEESSVSDFVSPDYYGASRRVAEALVQAGRSRFVFISSGSVRNSVSTRLRLAGFAAGLGDAMGSAVQLRVLVTEGPQEELGYQAMSQLLRQSAPPDAIYCAGDHLALGAIRALQDHNIQVPDGASVVGGTGYDLSMAAWPALTRLSQPLQAIGEAVVELLHQRLKQNGSSVPGRILPTPLVGGTSTRPQENELLGMTSHL